MKLTKTRFIAGVWEGMLTGAEERPEGIELCHLGEVVGIVSVAKADAPNEWLVRAPVPAETLSDGMQTYLIVDAQSQVLASFHLQAGEGLDEDIRAELDLMRAELDMLKKAFRRHCSETIGG